MIVLVQQTLQTLLITCAVLTDCVIILLRRFQYFIALVHSWWPHSQGIRLHLEPYKAVGDLECL